MKERERVSVSRLVVAEVIRGRGETRVAMSLT
jgi:hypothetical protein